LGEYNKKPKPDTGVAKAMSKVSNLANAFGKDLDDAWGPLVDPTQWAPYFVFWLVKAPLSGAWLTFPLGIAASSALLCNDNTFEGRDVKDASELDKQLNDNYDPDEFECDVNDCEAGCTDSCIDECPVSMDDDEQVDTEAELCRVECQNACVDDCARGCDELQAEKDKAPNLASVGSWLNDKVIGVPKKARTSDATIRPMRLVQHWQSGANVLSAAWNGKEARKPAIAHEWFKETFEKYPQLWLARGEVQNGCAASLFSPQWEARLAPLATLEDDTGVSLTSALQSAEGAAGSSGSVSSAAQSAQEGLAWFFTY
jgi:hypothetical protein